MPGTLRPRDLQRLTDDLVRDAGTIWRLVNADPTAPGGPRAPKAVIDAAVTILDDAYFVERLEAPSVGEIIFSLVGFAVALAAAGVGYAARDEQVISAVAYVIAIVAFLLSSIDVGWKIRRSEEVSERLQAIDRAKDTLRLLLL